MNPKIFVGIAILGLGAVIAGILAVGPTINLESSNPTMNSDDAYMMQPLEVTLDGVVVDRITERTANIEISFTLTNPNPRSFLISTVDYQLFETGYSDFEPIAGGQLGQKAEGFVEFSSNYFTLLGENSITLTDEIVLRNSGNTPQLWDDLQGDTASWRVNGNVFYNLSSMTSGQENEINFEFTQ